MTKPISTLSSIAFALLAGIVFSESVLFAGALAVLAAGSAWFHYSGEHYRSYAHFLDEWGMYAVALTFTFYAWEAPAFFVFFLGLALAGSLVFIDELDPWWILPALGILSVTGISVNAGVNEAAVAGLGALAAFSIRNLEQTDLIHGAWHISIAIALWYGWSVLV